MKIYAFFNSILLSPSISDIDIIKYLFLVPIYKLVLSRTSYLVLYPDIFFFNQIQSKVVFDYGLK